ncbi:MAG: tRNA-dihydrouridine synthase family protein [Lentisphaeria bacterium]|nr:tRNA-dihydrouridine synthase family protein [Lentisphaeria bacterium]
MSSESADLHFPAKQTAGDSSQFDFRAPLRLSDRLTLPGRAVLSPLQGVMTRTFMHAAARLDLIPLWFTPFFSTGGVSVPKRAAILRKLAPYRVRPDLPLVFQLIGHDARSLAATAAGFGEYGVNGINLNFACPSKTVTASGNGSFLLRSPETLFELTRAVVEAVPEGVSVSVKLRAGWDSPDRIGEVVRAVCGAGADWIVFHCRTAAEMYRPVDASERVRRIACAVEAAGAVPVFGNGDIASCADAENLVRSTGCAGVAVGRGFLSDPWLVRRILSDDENPASEEEKTAFLRLLLEGTDPTKRGRNWFLECVKMTYGAGSAEFREARESDWTALRARWS